MAKTADRSEQKDKARKRILDAAERLLRQEPHRNATIQQVAAEAGCAKGLVNYHFETKDALLAALADRLAERRVADWNSALQGPDVTKALGESWSLVIRESREHPSQMFEALKSVGSEKTVRSVNKHQSSYFEALSEGAIGLLERAGFRPTIPAPDLGALIACGIEGFVRAAGQGVPPERLEPSYSALWAAALSLTRRR